MIIMFTFLQSKGNEQSYIFIIPIIFSRLTQCN
ncbi:transmembrane protein, putative (macronuclear) [Tetrahymena thermophila SB210]|uniref:Transmembrane protein, putative n=1 Tax=Tetrahymena thermophila (strain SB210) TaxID=312017 RepID=W7X7A1_TETTS|nr:transmembrane protein, putative [Tetrahymena thermophila SB210]EWS73232.1 transmembrane protein, putative [Tetrahymena thermophila SB210]|eukprot:XP_012654233.1 transmembrane protein, putative [Tetrahymena thermophila SB210]